MSIDEFAVREVLGVAHIYNAYNGQAASVRLTEGDHRITLQALHASREDPPELTPDQARRLARHLYRLARRIDARRAGS